MKGVNDGGGDDDDDENYGDEGNGGGKERNSSKKEVVVGDDKRGRLKRLVRACARLVELCGPSFALSPSGTAIRAGLRSVLV